MFYKLFDENSSGTCANKFAGSVAKSKIMRNQELAGKLHKPVIRKLENRKLYSSFKDNIWSAYLADMQSLGKYKKGIHFLLFVINIYSKYAWAVPLKDKKDI